MKIAVGGMIAAGKSTIVKELAQALEYGYRDEFNADDDMFLTFLRWLGEGRKNAEMYLQLYFLEHCYEIESRAPENVVLDRSIGEHRIFAIKNLAHKPEVLARYQSLFFEYFHRLKPIDHYIILDISWQTFVDRLHQRGREAEINHFQRDDSYFRALHRDYTEKLAAHCKSFDVPYSVINTDKMTPQQVIDACKKVVL